MKKWMILVCFMLVAIVGIILFLNTDKLAKSQISVEHDGMEIKQFGETLYKQYDNLQDFEEEADLIIIGQPIHDLKALTQNQTKTTASDPLGEFWVDTPFQVNQVIKGNFEDSEITIAQPILINNDVNEILTLQGYSPLIEQAEYVLFLAKSEYGASNGQKYAWNIMSFNFGKYNLDGKDTIEDNFSNRKQIKLKKAVKKKYKVTK